MYILYALVPIFIITIAMPIISRAPDVIKSWDSIEDAKNEIKSTLLATLKLFAFMVGIALMYSFSNYMKPDDLYNLSYSNTPHSQMFFNHIFEIYDFMMIALILALITYQSLLIVLYFIFNSHKKRLFPTQAKE